LTISSENPVWRSLLFVPGNNQKFIDKAHQRGADAIIVDLEDSVPVTERDAARAMVPDAAGLVGRGGADVLVRINSTFDDWPADLDAAVVAGVDALMLTKVESAESVHERVERIEALESERGLEPGAIRLVVLAETPAAIFRLEEIARSHERIVAMGLGGEDFAASVGSEPGPDTLALPKQLMLYAARAAGLSPIGLMGTVADYKDLEAVRTAAPSDVELSEAKRIVDAYEEALDRGIGAITVDGWMIDVPVAERARKVLARAQAIADREARMKNAAAFHGCTVQISCRRLSVVSDYVGAKRRTRDRAAAVRAGALRSKGANAGATAASADARRVFWRSDRVLRIFHAIHAAR